MKKFLTSAAISLICMALACPQIDARGRNNAGNDAQQRRTEQSQRPGSNSNRRPGHNNNGNSNRPTQRPGHNNNGNNNRPAQRPGHNNNGNSNRPGNNGGQGNHRPNHDYNRPQTNHRPDMRPGHNNRPIHNSWRPGPPPPRPMMPAHRPWHRPVPPPHYRPYREWRPIRTILGLTIGSAINFGVNQLINLGYNVSGYGTNAVYVTNVPMLNMYWPDATLYYGNNGLYASEFVYSTPGYTMGRYNSTYNMLCQVYGSPYNVVNSHLNSTATWWGPGGQFIRLNFESALAANGTTRFFTTLSFGN